MTCKLYILSFIVFYYMPERNLSFPIKFLYTSGFYLKLLIILLSSSRFWIALSRYLPIYPLWSYVWLNFLLFWKKNWFFKPALLDVLEFRIWRSLCECSGSIGFFGFLRYWFIGPNVRRIALGEFLVVWFFFTLSVISRSMSWLSNCGDFWKFVNVSSWRAELVMVLLLVSDNGKGRSPIF